MLDPGGQGCPSAHPNTGFTPEVLLYCICPKSTQQEGCTEKRGCRKEDPWCLWIPLTWLLQVSGKWVSSPHFNMERSCSLSKEMQSSGPGLGLHLPGPSHCFALHPHEEPLPCPSNTPCGSGTELRSFPPPQPCGTASAQE